MKITDNIKALGDVHLGKTFRHGVPLHRKGHREEMVWQQFERELMDPEGCTIHVQVGDLFDEAIVPFGVIYRAARIYQRASETNQQTDYILYRGNHDASKDAEKVTAFKIFSAILKGLAPRVSVVEDEPLLFVDECAPTLGRTILDKPPRVHVFIPWHPIHTAAEMVELYKDEIAKAEVAWGHWDVDRRQEESTNYVPAAQLAALGITKIITGHDHNRREETIAGVPVVVTGSMQPYDHGQDEDGTIYVTRTLEDVLAAPDSFVDKHLRIRLERGQVLDVPIDCLQLTIIREGQEDEAVNLDVEFEEFDFDKLLAKAISQVGLDAEVAAAMQGKLQELKLQEDDQRADA